MSTSNSCLFLVSKNSMMHSLNKGIRKKRFAPELYLKCLDSANSYKMPAKRFTTCVSSPTCETLISRKYIRTPVLPHKFEASKPCSKNLQDRNCNIVIVRNCASLNQNAYKPKILKELVTAKSAGMFYTLSQGIEAPYRTFSVNSSENSSKIDDNHPASNKELSAFSERIQKKDQFKRAIKDYGFTVIVFHVALTITSLGFFYFLVSRYA